MSRILLILILTSVVAVPMPAAAQTVITGRILGPDGGPVPFAAAHRAHNASSWPRDLLETFAADEDGRFAARFDRGGLHRLIFTGLYHHEYEIPFYLEDGDSTDVTVTMTELRYPESKDSLHVYIGAFRGGDEEGERLTIVSDNGDGVFRLDLPADADTVDYSIRLPRHHAQPSWGPGREWDVLNTDRSGNVEAFILPNGESRSIEIDLSEFNHEHHPPSYELTHASSATVMFAEVYDDFMGRQDRAREDEFEKRGPDGRYYEYEFDWSYDISRMERRLRRERDEFTRQVRMVMRMRAGLSDQWLNYVPSRELAVDMIESIPPTSPLWSFYPPFASMALSAAMELPEGNVESDEDIIVVREAGAEYGDFVHAIRRHEDETAVRTFESMAVRWAFDTKQFELFEQWYAEYMEKYAGTRHADRMQERYRPNKAIAVGNRVPSFEVPSLEDPDEMITDESLLGTTYLMNFWATWCGPCVVKMESLHNIQERYAQEDFTVFAVSINFTRQEAHRFRDRTEWTLPWVNAHVDDWKPGEGIMKDMEVVAIPKSLLVGPDGTIIAVESDQDEFYEAVVAEMGY